MNKQGSLIKVVLGVAVIAATLFLPVGNASAVLGTWDFFGPNGGSFPSCPAPCASQSFVGSPATAGNILAQAFTISSTGLVSTTAVGLYQRNVSPNDKGLGACINLAACGVATGSAGAAQEINNLSGSNSRTLVRLDLAGLASGWAINSATISSVDDSASAEFTIYGSNSANPTLTGTGLATNGSNCGVVCTVAIAPGTRYLFFTVAGASAGDGHESFLIQTVAGTCTTNCTTPNAPVPEPASVLLLGSGLLGLGYWKRKKAAAAAV